MTQAQAHTTSVGYENAGAGAVNFWYGTYHGGTTFTEGSFSLVGQDVTYNSTVAFSLLTTTRPTGLIDGETNFYSDGTQLTGVDNTGGIAAWQGVSFTNLVAGTYVFTYIPIATPTSTWQPTDNIILSSSVTLSSAILGAEATPAPPPAPTIIDSSQAAFTQDDAAASGTEITFNGGVFSPSQGLSLDKPISLLAAGGTIDSTHGDIALTNVVEGAGGLTKTGAGVLTLSGANTYSGGTRIEGGVLSTQGQGALGAGPITGAGGTLQLGYAGALTQNVEVAAGGLNIDTQGNRIDSTGSLSGSGDLVKSGSGLLNLTGDSSFSGSATVAGGRLAVNGALGGATATVLDGAEIGGNGLVGGLIVRNRATAAPGNSIGKLTVGTFAIFERGSTYAVEVDAAGANDRIDVSGVATLEGGTVKVLAEAGDYQPLTDYTILSAGGGVNGVFEAVTSNLAFLSPTLTYSPNSVALTLVRNDLTFASVAETVNQVAVGAAVDQAFVYGSGVYDSLLRGTAADGRATFDLMSGEIHPAAATAAIADAQATRGVLLGRLRTASPDGGDGAWGQIGGTWGEVDADGNAGSVDRNTDGVTLGAEKQFDSGLRLGVAAGFNRTSIDLDARQASSDIKTTQFFVYGGGEVGGFDLRAGAGYGDLSIETDRTAATRAQSVALSSKRDASMGQAFIEAGRGMRVGPVTLEPTAGVSAFWFSEDGFRETTSDLALQGAGEDRNVVVSELGLHAQRAFGADDAISTRVGVVWRHTLEGSRSESTMAFQSGGPAFVVSTTPLDKDAAVLDAAVNWRVSGRLAASIGYQGSAGEHARDHAAQASLSFKF